MALKNDCSGQIYNAEVKLSNPNTTWNTRLKPYRDSTLTIVSYSIADIKYISKLLEKHRGKITILCHSKYYNFGIILKNLFPDITIYTNPHVHAKMVLAAPMTVWLSSENIGRFSRNFDTSVGIENEEIFNLYSHQISSLINGVETVEVKI